MTARFIDTSLFVPQPKLRAEIENAEAMVAFLKKGGRVTKVKPAKAQGAQMTKRAAASIATTRKNWSR